MVEEKDFKVRLGWRVYGPHGSQPQNTSFVKATYPPPPLLLVDSRCREIRLLVMVKAQKRRREGMQSPSSWAGLVVRQNSVNGGQVATSTPPAERVSHDVNWTARGAAASPGITMPAG